MIVTEQVTINNRDFIRTYSDEGRYVVRDGVSYSEAVDPIGTGRVYTEGEIMPEAMEAATEKDYLAALAELGVNTDAEG